MRCVCVFPSAIGQRESQQKQAVIVSPIRNLKCCYLNDLEIWVETKTAW